MRVPVLRACARADSGQTVNEKVLEDGSPAVGVRRRLVALGFWSAFFVEGLRGLALVIGAFSISISIFLLLLLFVSTTQLETCTKAEWNARKTGALLPGAGVYKS
jgi:hypothetical protein